MFPFWYLFLFKNCVGVYLDSDKFSRTLVSFIIYISNETVSKHIFIQTFCFVLFYFNQFQRLEKSTKRKREKKKKSSNHSLSINQFAFHSDILNRENKKKSSRLMLQIENKSTMKNNFSKTWLACLKFDRACHIHDRYILTTKNERKK